MDDSVLTEIFSNTPPLTIIAASFLVYNLFKKYKEKEITKEQFIFLSTKVTGLKAAKVLIFLSLLALPVIGQIVAVYLISKLILSAKGIFEVKKDKLLLPAF